MIAANFVLMWVGYYAASFALIIGSGLAWSWYATRKTKRK